MVKMDVKTEVTEQKSLLSFHSFAQFIFKNSPITKSSGKFYLYIHFIGLHRHHNLYNDTCIILRHKLQKYVDVDSNSLAFRVASHNF